MAELKRDGTKQQMTRNIRKKKNRSKSISSDEEWFSSGESSEEDETTDGQEDGQLNGGPWMYDLEKMRVKKEFEIGDIYREMDANDFTVDYVQENGLEEPLLFRDSVSSLGMKMPKDGTLTVRCVLKAVGDRQIEVVDVMTQGSRRMMLSDFVEYYESPPTERKDLLNVLSLEFSLTSLAKRVRSPAVAREIDWVELYWPKELRNSPTSFPKVQNYCLMSVKGSFTDFHVDFGGTSVWYHIYKGHKTFWIIEPTEENLLKYENWILEGTQYTAFFGDIVDKCARIELYEGYTFIIPSGWIHAVYTPEDSLVFGGNFLHSFSIPMQIQVSHLEDKLRIKKKYRYPRYMEMLWYMVENITKKATGRNYGLNQTREISANSTDEKGESVVLKEETADADNTVISVDNALENTAENGIKKEANESVIMNKGNEPSESKSVVTDATTTQVIEEESAAVGKKDEESPCSGQEKSLSRAEEDDFTFDDEYLATVSKKERSGYKTLLTYMREIIKDCSDSENRKMKDLLDVFEKVINYEVPEHFIIEKEKKKSVEAQTKPKLNQWLKAFGNNKSPVAKRKVPSKEKAIETQQFSRPKPPKAKIKSSKKLDHHKPDGPLIVGGIPPAIMPADAPQAPNPYGYDPLASVTPLGHKQLPSAYRRTPDMAKAPPSQKFRLQPQIHKAAVAASEKTEMAPEKAPEKPSPTSVTTVSEHSNADKSEEHEKKSAAVVQSGNGRSIHHGESWRSHRDREKDNQRENRNAAKEEYPELQYRSPLVRPGPSNSGTNIVSKSSFSSYRYPSKTFKRRYTDSASASERRSNDSRNGGRASDYDAKKNEYLTKKSRGPEPYRKSNSTDTSGSFSRSFARPWPQEAPAVVQHSHSAPGDPRLPSAEGLSRWSPAVKDSSAMEYERNRSLPNTHRTHITEVSTTSANVSPKESWKVLSPAGPAVSSQYVPLLNRERNPASASSVSNVDTFSHYPSLGSEQRTDAMASSPPLPAKRSMLLTEPQRTATAKVAKGAEEIKKPEIRDLSVTLNEKKDDGGEIMAAAEELAKLTKVFDADEEDSVKKKAEPSMIAVEQRTVKRQSSINLEKIGVRDRPSSQKSMEDRTDSPPPKLPKIPTETVIENLSSLTAEFNAVED